jgi:hypothetical protein
MNPTVVKASLLLSLLFAAPLQAAPHFDEIVVSDAKDGDAVDSFTPNTPKIFVHAHMVDIATGSKMTGTWIAVDTNGVAPANYKIDSSDLNAGMLVNTVEFSLSKPNNGWPVGKYRVDMSVDGKTAGTASFTVEPE